MEQPYAFESREYVRALTIGKPVKFSVSYTVQGKDSVLEFGTVYIQGPDGAEIDVGLEAIRNGWAKVREGKGQGQNGEEEEGSRRDQLRTAELEATARALGLWGPPPAEREVNLSMPEDPAAFLSQHKGNPIDAIIEAVPNGSTVRARLLVSPTEHQVISLSLAGLRAPRASNNVGENGEENGDAARFFLEARVLQRQVKITLLSLPTPAVAPTAFGSTSDAPPPPPASFFLGTLTHPAGNIAALLLQSGLAKIVDWHAGFLSQSPTPTMMAELREAEKSAKAARRGLWSSLPAPAPGQAAAQAQQEKDRKFDAVVTRAWNDGLTVVKVGETAERRVQFASTRAPRSGDPKTAGLSAEAVELLRKKLIGKQVKVQIDYVKPADGQFPERQAATVKLNNGSNIAVFLIEKGLLGVLRHRQGDDQRSSEWDKLIEAEAKAIAEGKGMHDGKDHPLPRIIDASESAQKAAPFLSSFKRAGRTAGVVDFVASGSRFKVYVPKQDVKLTLVLHGVRCPRTARNASERSEPYGPEAAQFATRQAMQRDVEFSVEATDKAGGFVGKLFLNGVDFAVSLVREGLAKLDDYATPSKELAEAQEEAKKAKKNIWKNFDAEAEAAAAAQAGPVVARREYIDVGLSEIRGDGRDIPFSFAVQELKDGIIPALEQLMTELNQEGPAPAPASFIPRMGEVVAAQFSQDDMWYRARIRRANPSKKIAEVSFIDYGNVEELSYPRLRPLSQQFKALPPQAKEATLSFIQLLDSTTEYGRDSVERFRDLCEGRQLVANVDAREANLLHLTLFDPKDPAAFAGPSGSINVGLIKDGLAKVDKRSRFRAAYPEVVKALDEAVLEAKRGRYGAYEMGDAIDDE